jgi:hypothetical protein
MSEARYSRTAHTCRTCLGPILAHEAGFVCAVCDVATAGTVDEICGCGITISSESRKNLGFRCVQNPARGAKSPASVVIQFGAFAAPENQAGAA